MYNVIITVIICCTALAAIVLLQKFGLPVVHIKHESVNPPITPIPEGGWTLDPADPEVDPNDKSPREKKEAVYHDIASLINGFLEGDVDIG